MKIVTTMLLLGAVSCTPYTVASIRGPADGYCFKAEGVSKMRCYDEKNECLKHQSIIHDNHPYAEITFECAKIAQ